MTLATRNRFIRLATVFSAVLVVTVIVSSVIILMHRSVPDALPGKRTIGALDHFFLSPYSPYASIAAIGLFPCIALFGLVYTLFAFEKTQTVEITFFAACLFALGFEAFRIWIPLNRLWEYGGFMPVTISRLVFAVRLFCLMALLASAITPSLENTQQLGSTVFLLAFISISLANVIPFNSANGISNFYIAPGYANMLNLFLFSIEILVTVSYLVTGATRGSSEYSHAAAGIALLCAGYTLLTVCDCWLILVGGAFS